MPAQITCASALPGKTGNTKMAFSLAVLPELNQLLLAQLLLDFFSVFDSRQ